MRCFRTFFVLVGLLLVAGIVQAAVPSSITVQGRLTDSLGSPLASGNKTMTFKIFDDTTAGTEIWPGGPGETQTVPSDAAGLWTTRIGALIPLSDQVFSDVVRWLEIDVDGTTLPRVRLASGATALRVATVDGASGGAISSKITIGPGQTNTGTDAFVAGADNVVNGNYASIGGGLINSAAGYASVIGGGNHNTTSNGYSTVAGGQYNSATGAGAFSGGGIANEANNSGATISGGTVNVASGAQSAVGGGSANWSSADGSTIGGGNSNVSADSMSTVAGGQHNKARGAFSVVAGGGGSNQADSNSAQGKWSAIGGGHGHVATGDHSVIAGGAGNLASGYYSAIGGGGGNTATAQFAAVAAGFISDATATYAFVGGGYSNTADGVESTIGGGFFNLTQDTCATIGGGRSNIANGAYSTIAGGGGPAGYPDRNQTDGDHASVGGGQRNSAYGRGATIPGGEDNEANGACSFAAGCRAKATYHGSFVWADTSAHDFYATATNQFRARATGGVQFVVAIDGTSGLPTWTADLAPGGSWTYTSDSTLKENFELVDGSALLNNLSSIPISRWNAKDQDDAIKHIGPMAQDFYAAFGLGKSDRQITTSDICGVALAAIQELDARTRKIEELESQIAELRQMVNTLSQ